MNNSILVAYATRHGSTQEVAEAIAATLRAEGRRVDVAKASDVSDVALYTTVVVGGALYMGHWHRDAVAFLKRHQQELARLPLAVFAMGPKTMAEADIAASRRQLENALNAVPRLTPASVAIFGGVVDPSTLRFPFSRMGESDARDWDAIRAWSHDVGALGMSEVGAVSV